MIVEFSREFKKRLKRAPKKVQIKFKARLGLFLEDQFNPLLKNHTLIGQHAGYRNINITGDWRAVYRMLDEQTAFFVDVGTHSYLYG
jgi:addiction module RelE/StbE family toxin